MSRHRLVKALDVDDELDVFDGDDGFDDEYDPDAERHLRDGTAKVKEITGLEFTDEEIRESLWHYYYDVEKTVNYLLSIGYLQSHEQELKIQGNRPTKTTKKPKPIAKSTKESGCIDYLSRTHALSAKDFFSDCPWLNVPAERLATITMFPLQSHSGLLGGSSNAPKQSKLGALAARRKKENDKSEQRSSSTNSSVALLDKLSLKPEDDSGGRRGAALGQGALQDSAGGSAGEPQKSRKYLSRKRPDLSGAKKVEEKRPEQPEESPVSPVEPPSAIPILAEASAFAQTLIGHLDPGQSLQSQSLHHYKVFPEIHAENPFAGPSPDDIVVQAQSKSKGLKNLKATGEPKQKDKPLNGLSNDLERTTIVDAPAPRIKSRNLDVVAEYEKSQTGRKNAANFVVIGHVDAGKSTLMGRLLHDLSIVDKRTMDKFQRDASKIGKSSFAFAWVLDEGSEERERGVTIDIASSKFETDSTVFTILDAPGHQDFVPNMIAGASRADFAVLVLDGSSHHFEAGIQGQTKEHALLVRSLGVQRLIAVVNKLDTIAWSQKRFEEISQQTSAFLTAAGFSSANVAFVPCSGLQGENVVTRSQLQELHWYKGTSLLEELEAAASPRTYPIRGPLRMPIADIVTGGSAYPLSVSGRINSGTLQVGESLVAVPGGATGYIRALEVDSEQKEFAVAGQNATLHISEMDAAQLRTGDVICSPKSPIPARSSFTLKALAFNHLTPMFVSLIAGRTNVQGRIAGFAGILDKSSGQVTKRKPRLVKPGEVARLDITVEAEGGLAVEAGARIVLRSGGETIATGLVE